MLLASFTRRANKHIFMPPQVSCYAAVIHPNIPSRGKPASTELNRSTRRNRNRRGSAMNVPTASVGTAKVVVEKEEPTEAMSFAKKLDKTMPSCVSDFELPYSSEECQVIEVFSHASMQSQIYIYIIRVYRPSRSIGSHPSTT